MIAPAFALTASSMTLGVKSIVSITGPINSRDASPTSRPTLSQDSAIEVGAMLSITRHSEPTVKVDAFMPKSTRRASTTLEGMQLRAHAKLNLALAVDGPVPPSGYHPLCSWFAPLSLFDTINISPSDVPSFSAAWAPDAPKPTPIDWPAESDLCVRALRAFERHTGAIACVQIDVVKRIPVGGGLGGGSSNAAAVLRGLRALFQTSMTEDALIELAKSIGSDVAYFCDCSCDIPRRAIVEGFGEHVTRMDDPRSFAAVLIVPPFPCSTRDVYLRADTLHSQRLTFASRAATVHSLATATAPIDSTRLFNDLSAAAREVAPQLNDIISIAEGAINQPVHLTGSGSTMFALATRDETPALIQTLRLALNKHDCVMVAADVL